MSQRLNYGFKLGDQVIHVRAAELGTGTVTELDADADLGGVTTCRVAWGCSSAAEAARVPRSDQSIHWTNKLRLAA